ncbi:hypothetical protein WN73_16740 [Bradyrhizobium sp. CCBAU 45394]|nr:hypothetical protein [Bradyrhizobium sp. CCBAU 45394]
MTFCEFVNGLKAVEDDAEHPALAEDALRRVHEAFEWFSDQEMAGIASQTVLVLKPGYSTLG